MRENESFNLMIKRLEDGDQDAANEVFTRFTKRLIGLARTRMNTKIRSKTDPEDIVQSVLRTFFDRHAKKKFQELTSWDSLWGLLARITLRKCNRRYKQFSTAARDLTREFNSEDSSGADAWEIVTREPAPEEIAMFHELMESVFRGLTDAERRILELRLQDESREEIAEKVGLSLRTVDRKLATFKENLESLINRS